MKKKFTFCNLNPQMRLLGLLTLFLMYTNVFSQTICRPVSQTNSAGGGLLCIGVDVNSPANAFDSAGLSTYATLSNGVAVAGCFAEETMTLNQTARAGDQVAIYFGTGNGLLDLTLLSNATVQAKNSGTNVGSSVALNSPLLNLNLLSGNTVAVAKFPITGDTNQIQIQVGGGLVALLATLRIYDVRLEFAQPTVSGGLTQTVCAGVPTTLTATPAVGTTLAWYSSEFSTTALAVGNTYTTPALTANTTYYIGITRAAGCEGNVRVPVVLNVSNPVAPAYSNVGTTVCSTGATQQTTLSLVNPVPGTTYNWYSSQTGGVSLASGTTYSPTVPLGTTSFFVEASIGSCISPTRTQINVVSTGVPATPTILTQSVTIQSGQNATLSAMTTDVGVQLNWYEAATGGTAVATNTTTFTTPILTATKTYYVEAQSANGNCVSATRVPVTVTVQPTALGGCLEASSQVTSQVGICLLCSATNLSNSVDGNAGTAASLSVPVGVAASIQQTLQFTNPGKAGDIVDVDLELPGGIADLSLLGAVSLATYNGATYNNDRVAVTNPLITLQVLSGNRFRASVTAGANFDRVEIRLGAVATVLSTLNIYQATYRYKVPTITGNTTICSGTTTTLTAGLAIGETVKWYNAATGGTSLASTAAFTTPALTTATTYYVEVTRNGCVNSVRYPVEVLIDNPVLPTTVTASPTTICSGQSTTLTVVAPVAGTDYNWYDAQTGGNLVFTGNSFATPTLTVNTSYFVEAAIGSCVTPTRFKVDLIVSPIPATPTFTASNVIIQSGQSATLTIANPDPTNVRYNWYNAATGGTLLATNVTSYTTPALASNTTYYVEASSLGTDCTNTARGAITVTVIDGISSCLHANAQAITRGGVTGCLTCGSTNDGNSVDNSNTTATTLTVPLGVLDYIQQTLTFTSSGQTGDIIDVELGIPTGLLDISALSNISLQSFNGSTPNADQTNISSLLNVQLLGGNRFRASFPAGGVFTSVQVRLTGLLTALSSLEIYDASYRFPNAVVTGATAPICAGQAANLSVTPVTGETFAWYDSATGGNAVTVSPTGPLTATTTYYLETTRGTCVNSLRQAVTVNVLPIPTAANITIASPVEATCTGTAVLTPSSDIAGVQFKYYTDQSKVTEILDGRVDGSITFAKDANGVLTISGLASGTTYNYYISALNGGTCENVVGDLKQVTVTPPSVTPLTVIATPLQACGSANLINAITNFDSSGDTTYTFYDPSNNVITADAAANITVSGVYSIQAQSTTTTCSSAKESVTVQINALPTLDVINPQESVNVGTNVTLDATSTGTVTWFNPQGVALAGPPFTTGPLNMPGVYTYTAVATVGTCTTTATKIINVIDLTSCQNLTERVYATGQSAGSIITGGVSNGALAVDGNPQTFSTITTGVGLLGIGTTWQNLTWPANIAKGTPVTVKLGSEYSLLAVGQNLSIVGTKNGNLIGAAQPVSGSLLNLISGDNTYEFTFVPSDASGPQDYDGIRVVSSSLVSVAQNVKVFDAHYNKPVTAVTCTPGDIQDIFYGATDLGLPVGALTAAVGVSDAWNVADNDVTTFATMYSGVSALASADLTVQFKTPSVLSDTLRIVVSKPGTLLTVNLLTGFSVQRYLGNVAVGAPIQNTSQLLSIKLLPGNSLAMVLVSSPTEIYDRVRIRLGGVVGVLDFLRVHTVERTANTTVIGADSQNKITVCPGTDITLQIPEVSCSTYFWYDAQTGGNQVGSGPSFTVPANLTAGIYKYYVQPVRYGCQDYTRGEVTVEVKGTAPVNALANITLNGGTATSICSASGTVTLATGLTGTPALTNPVYHWYKLNGSTTDLITGETTAQLIVNGLIPGTYTYFVGVSSDELCETAAADRKQITFTILPPSTVNDISVDDVTVCPGLPASLTPTATTLSSPVFTWYLDANKTQPITNGAVIAGVTYTINAAGVLTATGLTKAVSPITYYVAVSSTNTCENLAGTLQHAAIIVSDPNTPTTTDSTQNFCLSSASTVANIQVNESNVIWYDAATGGTAFASTDLLTNRIYYGAATDALTGCESSVRLAVTVNVNDPGTPTLVTAGTQNFCTVNTPTFASVQFNETNIVWYTALTGGTLIPSTTALTSGTYYAAISDPTTGCESATRLPVAVIVTDPTTPTTTDSTQNFCLSSASTVANIQVNESNVIWYDAATGGTAFASTDLLTGRIYYGVIKDPVTDCESSVRLAVTVNVNDPGTPTLVTAGTQYFCIVDAPTFASVQFNESNILWYTAATGGTAIAPTTALTSGTYYAAIKDLTTNCESATRLPVAVIVTDPATPTTAQSTQNFCLSSASTVANIQVNESNVVWYDAATAGTAFAPTDLLTGRIYYGAIKDPVTDCESLVRLAVTVIVNDPGTPTLVTAGTQNFCKENAPTFASVQFNESNIVWYTAMTGGTVIPSATALTSGTYYAAIKDLTTNCESATRLPVAVIVTDPATPTTTESTQNFCLSSASTVANIQVNESNVIWYDAATAGTAFALTDLLTSRIYYGAIKDPVTDCESSIRLAVTVIVNDPGTPTLVTAGTQNFCTVNAPTFASVQFNETNILWYTALTGGTLIPSATALTSGTYYAAIKDLTTNCESATRLPVAVIVTDPATPTTTQSTQNFCLSSASTVANIQVNESNVVWYDAATGGNLFASTDLLTSRIYYGAIKDPVTDCESSIRLAVTVIVNDPGTPTLVTAGTQNFCTVNAPTFASVQFNETNILWYTAATGGTLISSATALTSGTYYAAIKDLTTNCESATRLPVAVIVTDPATPTTTQSTQNFCLSSASTVANIQVNESNVIWYDAATGGTAFASTDLLTGRIYYGAIKDPVTDCESSVRLAVTVNVTDPATPTTTLSTQNFCLSSASTVANIQVNESNVVWYDAATGGNLFASTDLLTSRIYYGAIKDPVTNCESSVRLAVTVIVNDPGTPTLVTAGTQNFCKEDKSTFASIQTNETNIVWYTALTGGTLIPSTTVLTSGTYYAAIKDLTTNCESATRLPVAVIVNDPGTPTLVTAGTQNFCTVNAPTFASVQFNEANIVWYTAVTGGTLIPSTTALTSGIYYAAINDPTTGCQSADRAQVVIIVTDPATPTTNAAAQTFCTGTNPTVANIQVNESNVVWYATQTGGTALASTDALTTKTYFGVIKDPTTGCESSVRLQVAVTVGNTVNPTTNNTAQTFCSVNGPTVESIQVNESNVTWYTTATGGTAIAAGTLLASGIYFGNIVDPSGCESSTRLQVTVTVTNPSPTPTTNDTTQNFCTLNSPTVANIQVNEANVVWYSTATGGTAIPPTTALVTGTYYGAVSSANGCENPVRLAVIVNVNSPSVITTPRTTQTFCLSAIPTLANIFVNEANVVWYASATGGTPLANTTPLTATTYYAGSLANTFNGCDNGPRLGVTIAFENDAAVQIASTDDSPCVFKGVTYSIANGKSNYVWTINGGTIVSGGGTNDGSVTVSWSDVGTGTVTVAYVNNCDERTSKTLNVTVTSCSDLTITNTVDNPTPNFGDQVTFTVTVNNVGEGDFINTIVSDLLPSGLQLVSSSATAGTYDPATQVWTIPSLNAGQSVVLTVVAEVLPSGTYTSVAAIEISTPLDVDQSNNSASVTLEPICLTVYNEFTPNNDGKNDLFRIDCIETHPNNELKVFNRYGALVYSKTHYENDWDGTANVSGVVNRGDMLPTGTYFYVITIGDGTVKKGWLSIMR